MTPGDLTISGCGGSFWGCLNSHVGSLPFVLCWESHGSLALFDHLSCYVFGWNTLEHHMNFLQVAAFQMWSETSAKHGISWTKSRVLTGNFRWNWCRPICEPRRIQEWPLKYGTTAPQKQEILQTWSPGPYMDNHGQFSQPHPFVDLMPCCKETVLKEEEVEGGYPWKLSFFFLLRLNSTVIRKLNPAVADLFPLGITNLRFCLPGRYNVVNLAKTNLSRNVLWFLSFWVCHIHIDNLAIRSHRIHWTRQDERKQKQQEKV